MTKQQLTALFSLVHDRADSDGTEDEILLALEACKELGDRGAQKYLDEGAFNRAVWEKEAGNQIEAIRRFEDMIEAGKKTAACRAEIKEIWTDAVADDWIGYDTKERLTITQAMRRHFEKVAA
jgi:hypothetical protein